MEVLVPWHWAQCSRTPSDAVSTFYAWRWAHGHGSLERLEPLVSFILFFEFPLAHLCDVIWAFLDFSESVFLAIALAIKGTECWNKPLQAISKENPFDLIELDVASFLESHSGWKPLQRLINAGWLFCIFEFALFIDPLRDLQVLILRSQSMHLAELAIQGIKRIESHTWWDIGRMFGELL